MRTESNEGMGQRVCLLAGDSLEAVPGDYAPLVTDRFRDVFADPVGWLSGLAVRCEIPEMQRWLRTQATAGEWELRLAKSEYGPTRAGYYWQAPGVSPGYVIPCAGPRDEDLPAVLAAFYELVESVHWEADLFCSGGIGTEGQHPTLNDYWQGEWTAVDADTARLFAVTPAGDAMVYSPDGLAFFVSHEALSVVSMGALTDAINFIFTRLNADAWPEYPH